MKLILRRQLIFLLTIISLGARSQSDTSRTVNDATSSGCTNGTHTDPTPALNATNGWATPHNNTFQQNTFDWRGLNNVNVFTSSTGKQIQNPFFSTTNADFFTDQANSDFNPKDGWELIKQDFGYFYSNSAWNGGIMGDPSGIEPGDPRGSPSNSIKYFVLYNKYTSVLRVFAYLPPKTQDYNSVNIRLRFLTAADYTHSAFNPQYLPDPSDPTRIYYQPSICALFNNYHTTSLALDQNTDITEVEAPAIWPAVDFSDPNVIGEFVHADFHLSYDPCICLFQAGFEVNFYHISSANLTLSGRYAGANSNINVADITANTGPIAPGSINQGDIFIASMFDNGGAPENMIQSYSDMNTLNNNSVDFSFQTYVALATLLLNTSSGAAAIAAPDNSVKDVLDGLSKVSNFFSTDFSNSSGDPPVQFSFQSGYLQASGSIVAPANDFPGVKLRIGIPGTQPPPYYPPLQVPNPANTPVPSGPTLPEYGKPTYGGEIVPGYPIYNEPPGLFTLLKTPALKEFDNYITYGTGYNYTYSYETDGNLVYKFNPIVDQSRSKVYTAVEYYGNYDDLVGLLETNNASSSSYPGLQGLYDNTLLNEAWNAVNDPNLFLNTSLLRTVSYPINCYNQTYFQISGSMSTPGTSSRPANHGAGFRLVVMLDLVTNPDEYGVRHRISRVEKYTMNINQTNVDFTTSSAFQNGINAIQNAGNNLVIAATNYGSPNASNPVSNDIFSFGDITITGNQLNTWSTGHIVNIIASDEIAVNPESALLTTGSDLVLETQYLPTCFGSCDAIPNLVISSNELNAYCQGGQYQGASYLANQADPSARRSGLSDNNQNVAPSNPLATELLGKDYKIGLYPNPTSNVVNVGFYTANECDVMLTLEDLTGKEVLTSSFKTQPGGSSTQLSLKDLTNGLYTLKVSDQKGNLLQTSKVVLSK